jgi:hypothetical protein
MTIKVYDLAAIMALEAQQQGVAHTHVADTHEHITDEEIIERLRIRFKVLDDMATAVKQGLVRALVVTGAPGVGKTYGVEAVLSQQDPGDKKFRKYEVVKGKLSPLMLYTKLYEYKESGDVLVFDDCDDVLQDDTSLNILKAALDSSDVRTINWNTASRHLTTGDIPTSFDYEGAVIFITNVKFDHNRSDKLRPHLEAIESRCHYLDLTIDTVREKMLRIKQIVSDGMLDKYCLSAEDEDEMIDFIETNKERLRGLSLRMVNKIAELRTSFPDSWKEVARMTCMRSK